MFNVGNDADGEDELLAGSNANLDAQHNKDLLWIVFVAKLDQTGLFPLFPQRIDWVVEEQLVWIVLGEPAPALVQIELRGIGGSGVGMFESALRDASSNSHQSNVDGSSSLSSVAFTCHSGHVELGLWISSHLEKQLLQMHHKMARTFMMTSLHSELMRANEHRSRCRSQSF